MLSNTFQLYILYLLIFIILILFGGFGLFLKRLFDIEDRLKKKEEKIIKQYQSILLRAHRHAETIVAQAGDKKNMLDGETREINKEIIANTTKKAEETIEELTGTYESDLSLLEQHILEETKHMFASIAESTKKDIDQYVDTFAKQTIAVNASLQEKAESAVKRVEEELSVYKTSQVMELTEASNELIMKLSQEVLGRTITASEHRQLILKTLEKAKVEGILLNDRT